MTRKVLYW